MKPYKECSVDTTSQHKNVRLLLKRCLLLRFDCLKHKEISDTLNGCVDVMSILNLSVPSDVNHIQTHKEKKVLLYYVNLEWNQGFHGETLFYTEDLESIQFASPYTPGRIMVFDANIQHTIRPQSIIAPQYRFSLSIFFNNK